MEKEINEEMTEMEEMESRIQEAFIEGKIDKQLYYELLGVEK
jgi:hypothetical protein